VFGRQFSFAPQQRALAAQEHAPPLAPALPPLTPALPPPVCPALAPPLPAMLLRVPPAPCPAPAKPPLPPAPEALPPAANDAESLEISAVRAPQPVISANQNSCRSDRTDQTKRVPLDRLLADNRRLENGVGPQPPAVIAVVIS